MALAVFSPDDGYELYGAYLLAYASLFGFSHALDALEGSRQRAMDADASRT
jgi:hypothetical protein